MVRSRGSKLSVCMLNVPPARATNTMMTPSFIGVQTDSFYPRNEWTNSHNAWNIMVPGCACRFDNGAPTPSRYNCRLPSCAVAAFKNLQVQQIAHTNSIVNLEQSMNKLSASLAPTSTPESPANVPNLHHGLIREEVRLMLNALRGT